MSLLDRITSFFRPEQPSQPSKLRNKPGGMAWIVGIPRGSGTEIMNGRAVRTVRVGGDGYWEIEPVQEWLCTKDTLFRDSGCVALKGQTCETVGIHDCHLEPWKDLGSDAQDESLWASSPRESHSKPRVGA